MSVYFIRGIDNTGPVKIGWSNSPQRRLSQIQKMSPVPLEILLTIDNCKRDYEKVIHRYFFEFKIRGEWFRGEKRLMEFIENPIEIAEKIKVRETKEAQSTKKERGEWSKVTGMKISYCKTKKEDWIVFRVFNALEKGIGKTNSHEIGRQFAHYLTEKEAIAFAEGMVTSGAILVDWEYSEKSNDDLVTQAEAAQIMAGLTRNKPLVQTIHNAIDDGRLESYQNFDATDQQIKQRHGLTLVSRSEVEWLWGERSCENQEI